MLPMLILTRKNGQGIIVEPHRDLDYNLPIGELFEQGPIEVTLFRRNEYESQFIIRADKRFVILRKELYKRPYKKK